MSTVSISRSVLRSASRIQTTLAVSSKCSSVVSLTRTSPAQWSNATTVAKRGMVSASPVLQEQKTLKLPGLGDSITEGAIVEWTASVGQAVKEGDIVAMVETDKVTVDIKAEMDGVIVEHFCEVDDNIEVGADLYKIDTDAEASVSAETETESGPEPAAVAPPSQEAPSKAAPAATAPTPAVAPASKSSFDSHRTPSIHFLGKDGWNKRKTGEETLSIVYLPPNYGRPVISEEEIESLIMGGANLTPGYNHSPGSLYDH